MIKKNIVYAFLFGLLSINAINILGAAEVAGAVQEESDEKFVERFLGFLIDGTAETVEMIRLQQQGDMFSTEKYIRDNLEKDFDRWSEVDIQIILNELIKDRYYSVDVAGNVTYNLTLGSFFNNDSFSDALYFKNRSIKSTIKNFEQGKRDTAKDENQDDDLSQTPVVEADDGSNVENLFAKNQQNFIKAVQKSDLNEIKEILGRYQDNDATRKEILKTKFTMSDGTESAALFYILCQDNYPNRVSILNTLIRQGADIQEKWMGLSLLYFIGTIDKEDFSEVIQLLSDCGANIHESWNNFDGSVKSLLTHTLESDSNALNIKKMIELGVIVTKVDYRNIDNLAFHGQENSQEWKKVIDFIHQKKLTDEDGNLLTEASFVEPIIDDVQEEELLKDEFYDLVFKKKVADGDISDVRLFFEMASDEQKTQLRGLRRYCSNHDNDELFLNFIAEWESLSNGDLPIFKYLIDQGFVIGGDLLHTLAEQKNDVSDLITCLCEEEKDEDNFANKKVRAGTALKWAVDKKKHPHPANIKKLIDFDAYVSKDDYENIKLFSNEKNEWSTVIALIEEKYSDYKQIEDSSTNEQIDLEHKFLIAIESKSIEKVKSIFDAATVDEKKLLCQMKVKNQDNYEEGHYNNDELLLTFIAERESLSNGDLPTFKYLIDQGCVMSGYLFHKLAKQKNDVSDLIACVCEAKKYEDKKVRAGKALKWAVSGEITLHPANIKKLIDFGAQVTAEDYKQLLSFKQLQNTGQWDDILASIEQVHPNYKQEVDQAGHGNGNDGVKKINGNHSSQGSTIIPLSVGLVSTLYVGFKFREFIKEEQKKEEQQRLKEQNNKENISENVKTKQTKKHIFVRYCKSIINHPKKHADDIAAFCCSLAGFVYGFKN